MSDQHQTRAGCTRPVLTLLAIAFFLVVGIFVWRTYAYPSLEDGIRAKGEPVTLAELDAWYTPVPDERNAAPLVLLAGSKRQAHPPDAPLPLYTTNVSDKYGWDGHGAPLPDEPKAAAAEYLAANKECLDLIGGATALTECRYPVVARTVLDGRLAHLDVVRELTQLQTLDAIYKTEAGDIDGACESIARTIRLSETLKNEPILISQFVRVACHGLAITAFDHLLNRRPLTDEQLAKLQGLILAAEYPDAMYRALAGERCFTTDAFYGFGGGSNGLLWRFGRSSAAKIYTRAVDASRLPSVERRQKFALIEQDVSSLSGGRTVLTLNFLAAALVPSWSGAIDTFDRDTAQLRLAAAAIAIERYRVAHGQLPDTLDVLLPGYLDAIPVDPFDGKPLRYIRNDAGYTVYSIGIDLKDDQGAESPKGNAKAGDIVLKVTR